MSFAPYSLTYQQYNEATIEQRKQADNGYWDKNRVWFLGEIQRLKADFIVFGAISGEIYIHGSINEFPNEAELEKLANDTNEVPIAWSKQFPIEEIAA